MDEITNQHDIHVDDDVMPAIPMTEDTGLRILSELVTLNATIATLQADATEALDGLGKVFGGSDGKPANPLLSMIGKMF